MISHTLRGPFADATARMVLVAALLACVTVGASAQMLVGPLPYLGLSDSPFNTSHPSFVVETLEDGLFNMPGVTVTPSYVILAPGGTTDSVDADDGAVDGSGNSGRNLFVNPGTLGLRFAFNPAIIGSLPTYAGVVCTDGNGSTIFEAFDSAGALIGQIGPVNHFDGSFSGGTAEDRFFGIAAPSGIASIRIRTTGGNGMEVDHVQYSLAPCNVASIQIYGAGCSLQTAVAPTIGSVGLPVLGSTTFAISVSNAAPFVPLLLVCGTDGVSVPFSGCDVLVSGSIAFVGPTSSFNGSASFLVGIPNRIALIGVALYGQWLSLDSAGPFLASGSLSNGIGITVGL